VFLPWMRRGLRAVSMCVLLIPCCGTPPPPPSPVPSPAPAGGVRPEAAYRHLFDDTFLPAAADGSGSGVHGTWETERSGLPPYRYTMEQLQEPRAAYFTSRGQSRDHWHQLGNDAVTLTAHNGG